MTTFQLGPYIVQQRHEADLYRIMLGDVLIGKCFSRPCESDCRWLEQQQRQQTFYAYSSAPLPRAKPIAKPPVPVKRRVGRPRKPETLQDIEKALAGG